jgi:nucleoid DNA-binding protein
MSMTKLSRRVAVTADVPVAFAKRLIRATLDGIADELAEPDSTLSFKGFGTFRRKRSKGRDYWHPTTREKITVPDHDRVAFKASGGRFKLNGH